MCEELSFIFHCFLRVIIVTSRHNPKVKELVDVIFPSSGGQLAMPPEKIYIHENWDCKVESSNTDCKSDSRFSQMLRKFY